MRNGIQRGNIYRFRYRVRNVNGWSEYSNIAYIEAYSIPEPPPAPIFQDADATTVTLQL